MMYYLIGVSLQAATLRLENWGFQERDQPSPPSHPHPSPSPHPHLRSSGQKQIRSDHDVIARFQLVRVRSVLHRISVHGGKHRLDPPFLR